MLSINNINSALARVVRQLVGTRLSSLPADPNNTTTIPSVILNRSNVPKPSFPYGVVDHIGLNREGYSTRASYLNENEEEVDEFDYTGRFLIQFNGSNTDDVLSICQELVDRLFTSKGKRIFKQEMDGLTATILKVSDISFLSTFLSTDYEEVARITIDLSLRNIIVDETPEVIENVTVQGELFEDLDDPVDPLTTITNAP